MKAGSRNPDFTAFYDVATPAREEVISLYGPHWRGSARDALVVVFRDSGMQGPDGIERLQEIALGSLGHRRALASALARGFVIFAGDKAPVSRQSYASFLRPFFLFLDESDPDGMIVELRQVDTSLVNRFVAWLSQRTTIAQDGSSKPLSRPHKERIYAQLKLIMDTLRRDGRHNLATDCSFRRNPWPIARGTGAGGRIPDASRILSDGELRAIHKACRREATEVIERFTQGKRLIAEFDGLGETNGDGLNLGEFGGLLAALQRRHGGVLPSMQHLLREDHRMVYAIRGHGGRAKVLPYLVPTPASLLPFVILLAMRTFFNPDTLLGIKDSACREAHWLWGSEDCELIAGDLSNKGTEELSRLVSGGLSEAAARRLVLSSYKGRKHGMVTRTFRVSDEWDSPSQVVTEVRRLTARVRAVVPETWQDRLFLFQVPYGQSCAVRSFMSTHGPSTDGILAIAMRNFRERHGLTRFSLRSFRLTGADIVWEATDGSPDAVATMLGNHPKTANSNYCTPGNVKRAEHRLAAMTNRRVRMVETGGKSRIEFTACTPGFHCVDPYDSPLPGQAKGRLCSAYPMCPKCPLASLDRSRPEAVAWLLSLADGIGQAASTVDPARYSTVYIPILEALRETWLPTVSDTMRREAEALTTYLPPSPEME